MAAKRPAKSKKQVRTQKNTTSIGATEDMINMGGAVPQRIDNKGTKVEDLAGTGEQDSKGG